MPSRLALAILALQCCEICVSIKVPVVWDGDNSEVINNDDQFSVEQFKPKHIQQPIPAQYFEYTAKKPQFAVDIAAFHGVHSPENHYTARPVRPFTGKEKPELGKHRIQNENRPVFEHFQKFINKNEEQIKPTSIDYSVFHPYKIEEAGLQRLYKDPTLDKIRNDIRDSSQRLQKYENEAGKVDITKDEYLESPDETDYKKVPQKNVPVPYEIHRPQRRPVYYKPTPHNSHRDQVLNRRFRHPWNQKYIKIRPVHYDPLKNHLQRLRQQHALRYGDEQNEYPQVPLSEPYEEPSDGYDIYEKGRAKFVNLRNNLDESVNDLVRLHRPVISQKLELQNEETTNDDDEKEFVPIKNYAQVRKTETTKHLPKEAAYDDAETYEEIKNAPRLREAIKSSKAQIFYTEEGYEDSAYDHAGEQKHASDHEAHGGFLRENERSNGKYKTPSVSASFTDGGGSAYKDQLVDAKKWQDNNKDHQKEEESEDYSEKDHEHSAEEDNFSNNQSNKVDSLRNKRQDDSESDSISNNEKKENHLQSDKDDNNSEINNDDDLFNNEDNDEDLNALSQHDVNKREVNFEFPEIDLNSTFFDKKDILEIAKEKLIKKDELKEKYPYFYENLKALNKNSPLRYAENLKLIPKKTSGGTEFYDSRSKFECPEVEDDVDPIPDKLKKNGHPDKNDDESTEEKNNNKKGESVKLKPRLQGLGEKIDCFKAKYFGENPLDSPFFKEEIISGPEPVIIPNISTFKLTNTKPVSILQSASDKIVVLSEKLNNDSGDIHTLLEKLKNKRMNLKETLNSDYQKLLDKFKTQLPQNTTLLEESDVFTDVLQNIKSKSNIPSLNISSSVVSENIQVQNASESPNVETNTYKYFFNKEDITKAPVQSRKKRATPFVYEPYKIIRDVQTPDTKKTTTTTANVSPLIKQLQTSKVIDVVKSKNEKEQPVKRNIRGRKYKDIGKKDREILNSEQNDSSSSILFNVSADKRRGEPRYEIRPTNHKPEYTPVENKKAMSVTDYEIHAKKLGRNESNYKNRPSASSLFHIANNLQKSEELQNLVTSSSTRKTVSTQPSPPQDKKKELVTKKEDESAEDYDEDYDDDDEDEEDEEENVPITTTTTTTTTSTTTTTTPKPSFKRKIRPTATTENLKEDTTLETPKLRLVTRFRNAPLPRGNVKHIRRTTETPVIKQDESIDESLPKYKEKKKTSSESTIVTDTKRYGDDNEDDMRKEEIDALIGVKQDMNDYIPLYEKGLKKGATSKNIESSEEEENSEESFEEEDEDDDDEEVDDDDDDEEAEETVPDIKTEIITKEPPKRTLARTTDAPPSTTEARSAKLEIKPVVTKKKYEVHKELPVNKSAPHMTQFKEDIEEVVITKEIPRKIQKNKQNKNLEVLDLYKDDNLASDINKLGDVEVFQEDLDLAKSPKHGGNYKYAPELEKETEITSTSSVKLPKDTETSQSENKKLIELDDQSKSVSKMHGGNLKSISEIRRSRGDRRNAKLVELSELKNEDVKQLHGGNLKSINDRGRRRGGNRNEKLIELNDSNDDDDSDSTTQMHGGNFKPYGASRNSGRGMHGGNYRSSKLIKTDNINDERNKELDITKSSNPGGKSADLLNSFAQAVPILTTTPAFILDPSKRMYYYVD